MADLNELKPVGKLSPFAKFCCTIGNLPASYMISLTYEEQLLWLCNYLEKTVIPAVNTNAEAVQELQEFFANLDVQDEIDNKLDEMVESGELQEIITSYLQINGVLAFLTLDNLKNATNLINGSFARTFGKNNATDGKGEFYRIRTMTSSDVVDNDNIVKVNFSNTLIAEKQKNLTLDILNSDNFLFIGDSYGAQQNGWVDKFCQFNNLTIGTNAFNFCVGGAGFVSNNTNTFYNNSVARENQISDKTKIKNIIICGGWNDRGASETELINAISNLSTYLHTTYPNAKIYCGMIGNTKDVNDTAGTLYWRNHLLKNILPRYKKCIDYNISYLYGVEEIMHNYDLFQDDNIHPNENGSIELGRAISNAFNQGYCKPEYIQTFNINKDYITLNEDIVNTTNCIITKEVIDGIANFIVNGSLNINNKNTQYKAVTINICNLTNDITFMRFVDNNSYLKVNARAYNGTNYYLGYGTLRFTRNGSVQLQLTFDQDFQGITSIDAINVLNNINVMFT